MTDLMDEKSMEFYATNLSKKAITAWKLETQ